MKQQASFFVAAVLAIGCAAAGAQSAHTVTAAAPLSVTVRLLPAAAQEDMYADALRLYREGRWSAAYGRFLRLADGGNADAARIALMMLRHGHDLYGTEWTAAPSQVAQWESMVGAARPLQVVVAGE
jgi:hypothetical protein